LKPEIRNRAYRGGAVEPRTTSSGGKISVAVPFSFWILASNNSADRLPMALVGCATIVSGGSENWAHRARWVQVAREREPYDD